MASAASWAGTFSELLKMKDGKEISYTVKEDVVPPTINHAEGDEDPEIDYKLNFTFNTAQHRTVRAALSNTFGFGGHNACVIIKKYTE